MVSEDKVRVLRIIEYVGPRSDIEKVLEHGIQGTKTFGRVVVRSVVIGSYPEILERIEVEDEGNSSKEPESEFPPGVFGIRLRDETGYFFGPTRDLKACLDFPGDDNEVIYKLSDDGSPDKPLYSWDSRHGSWSKIISPVPDVQSFSGFPNHLG